MNFINFMFKTFHIKGYYKKKNINLTNISKIRNLDNRQNFIFSITPKQQPSIDSCFHTCKEIIHEFYNFDKITSNLISPNLIRTFNLSKISKIVTLDSLFNIFYYHNGPIIVTIRKSIFCNHCIVLCGINEEQIIYFDPWNNSFVFIKADDLNKIIIENRYECI